ncbi:ABC transporter ATP-binding protein [Labrys wisconsinensis]|uniref:Branched-chain amino acid transport system ATP-binding protein n=1 Tax=Labrys wisconsinensis TaxID=425677 RepID=A0ABU0JHY4_9HYPH|nr:ABC transporter ATP-binding protein [Labrys wisconsinensis]MDQ0473903.1 branched-chain amino acid transport system ATP-binding protein [Labrys wisconsinensis]
MLLELKDVRKAYGSLVVTDGVSLSVTEGEALGVIGPNGAGKTTLFALITGAVKPDAGAIRLDGRDITAMPAAQRCRAGICRSHQIPHPFETLTVFENLLVAACFGRAMREAEAADWCVEVLALTGLLAKANRLGGTLTLLDRKRLEMARALATRPRLLLLDEIAGGLTSAECEALVGTIRTIHAGGTTIVWIEHIVHALLAVVGRLTVLNFGRKIAEGEARSVIGLPEVRDIYLGSPV